MSSYAAPIDARTSTTITGASSLRPPFDRWCRARGTIHTTRAITVTGHTQPAAVSSPSPGLEATRTTPVAVMAMAGTLAQACGWADRLSDQRARSAQPIPDAIRMEPVTTPSVAPGNTARVRTSARTPPAATEVATVRAEDHRRGVRGA